MNIQNFQITESLTFFRTTFHQCLEKKQAHNCDNKNSSICTLLTVSVNIERPSLSGIRISELSQLNWLTPCSAVICVFAIRLHAQDVGFFIQTMNTVHRSSSIMKQKHCHRPLDHNSYVTSNSYNLGSATVKTNEACGLG